MAIITARHEKCIFKHTIKKAMQNICYKKLLNYLKKKIIIIYDKILCVYKYIIV